MSLVTRMKDKSGAFHDLGVKWAGITPIAEKTYTGLVASSNTNGSGADFIMIDLAHDSDIRKLFRLRLRIDAEYKRSNDNVKYTSTHECLITGGSGNQSICSAMWNSISNTNYRAIYYLVAYRPSTNTANWKIGVCLYNCNNNTSSTNPRTVTIKVMSQENCTAMFYDTCANTDYATYYKNMTGRSAYDLASTGLQESGDNNNIDRLYYWSDRVATGIGTRVGGYNVVGFNKDGDVMPFCWYGTTSYSSNLSPTDAAAASARTFNTTNGFNYKLGMLYYNSSTNLAASTSTTKQWLTDGTVYRTVPGIDWRIDDNLAAVNCTETNIGLATGKPVYLRGVIKEDGLFYIRPFPAAYAIVKGYYYNSKFYRDTGHASYVSLSTVYTYQDVTTGTYYKCTSTSNNGTFAALTDETIKSQKKYIRCSTQVQPTAREYDEDGYQYVYWCVGSPYYNGSYVNGAYQLNLHINHDVFWFNGEAFCPYEPDVSWSDIKDKPTTFAPSAHEHSASEVTSGTFDAARIPSLSASKITSGTFDSARIPNLDASKITTGTIADARIASASVWNGKQDALTEMTPDEVTGLINSLEA